MPHLGAGHADLGACVDVHPAVGLAGDGAAHGVGDAHGQGSPLLAVPKAHQGVCCLPWNTGKHREAQGWGLSAAAPAATEGGKCTKSPNTAHEVCAPCKPRRWQQPLQPQHSVSEPQAQGSDSQKIQNLSAAFGVRKSQCSAMV